MLDVYRTYYQLTGEPFRLGPDHRFSLHHSSYANAKAYLEFAIYQGEGFIAITGGPGTGKTTLISEIMATLDRGKIEIATLNSTQLESRDLLQMVASSFGLHPEKINKADLLLEIEAFLITRVRSGHRAILIVDEAQGLSPGALEELRLLANLQFQYQLLLQIVLIGQERLLELIHSPGMEHLQQRLVAATSLEPLDFDETIDYIEHRLKRVGWQGDPAIDEPALRLVYRYSGGIPRRINLIANRLFLYGGMQEKHRFDKEDARNVIDGLVEEALLPAEPLIADVAVVTGPPAPGEQSAIRYLPRDPEPPADTAEAAAPEPQDAEAGEATAPEPKAQKPKAQEPKAQEPKTQQPKTQQPKTQQPKAGKRAGGEESGRSRAAAYSLTGDSMPGSRRQPREASARDPSAASGAADGGRLAGEGTEAKTGLGKGLLILMLLLVGAAGGYLLYSASSDFQGSSGTERDTNGVELRAPLERTLDGEPVMQADTAAPLPRTAPRSLPEQAPDAAAVDASRAPVAAMEDRTGSHGQIIRAPEPEVLSAADAADAAPVETDRRAAAGTEAIPPSTPAIPAPLAASAAEQPAGPLTRPADPVAPTDVDTDAPDASVEASAPVVARAANESAASPEPAPLLPAPALTGPAVESLQEQRARLKQAAEQRFSEQVARLEQALDNGAPVPAKPATRPPPIVATEPAPAQGAEPEKSIPTAKKKRFSGPEEIKAVLLQRRWTSSGKPASLLPSESTLCESRSDRIWCVSVPQNVKTQYGIALYKVETTLLGFSTEGHFEMAYRTLVKLVGADTPGGKQVPGATTDGGWQITDYSMSCTLIDTTQVSCLDDKGVTRRYLGTGSGSR